MPLLPMLYGGVLSLGMEWGRFLSLLLATTGLLALWCVASKRYGAAAAGLAVASVLLADFHGAMLVIMTQPLTFSLTALALFCAHQITDSKQTRVSVLFGVFCGLCAFPLVSPADPDSCAALPLG